MVIKKELGLTGSFLLHIKFINVIINMRLFYNGGMLMSNNYNVIRNGKKVNMELKDIFDKYKYQTLQTITPLTLYNIEFLEKYIFEYDNVNMLVDLNSNNNMSSVDNHVLAHNTAIRIRLLKTNKIQAIYNELSNRTKVNYLRINS